MHALQPFSSSTLRLLVSLVAIGATTVLLISNKRAEDLLRQRAELLELSRDMIFATDRERSIIFWNKACEESYGWTRSEAIGRKPNELLLTEFPDSMEASLAELQKRGSWEGQLIQTTRAGQRIPVLARWSIGKDSAGQVASILEVGTDARPGLAARDALIESEHRYRTMFEHAPVAILSEDWSGVKRALADLRSRGVSDIDEFVCRNPEFIQGMRKLHSFNDVNRTTLKIFGFETKEAFFGAAPRLIPANYQSNIHMLRALFYGDLVAQGRRVLKRSTGPDMTVLWQTVIPQDDEGLRRLLFFATDITRLVEAENRLLDAQAGLARAGRVSLVGELAASIAHEVNQPLAAMAMFASSARSWLSRPEPELGRAAADMDRMVFAAEQANEILFRTRAFLSEETHQFAPVAIQDVISAALLLVQRDMDSDNIDLQVSIGADLPCVTGDSVQLQQTVVNLLLNAVQAMSEVDATKRRIELVATAVQPCGVSVTVKDAGPGISAELSAKVFEPFFSTKRNGMGMGLAICRTIVEAHGGSLEVIQGEGGILRLWLPGGGDVRVAAANPFSDASQRP
nr:PAS domain S-box protein [Sphingomonas xinjiangensis]